MDEIRDPKVVLREAELLASSPETVAEWLRGHNRWSLTDPADDSLEANLLAREHRLIDLALARYGQCREVLRALFSRDDEVLRAATLSNENIYKYSIQIAPFLESECQKELRWLGKLSDLELKALFFNPALPANCIRDFFDMEGAWAALNDSQRRVAAGCLVQNMMQWPDTFNALDASTWDNFRLDAARSAWEFAGKAEITPPWPYWLGHLYSKLGIPSYTVADPLQMASRWTNSDDEEKSKKDNESGNLTTYQEVRRGLGRLAAARASKKELSELMAHHDLAIRCGAYLVGHLSAEQVNAACKNDGKLACSHLIENEHVWKNVETRDILEEACKKSSKGQDWVISLSHYFYRQRDRMIEAHPDWYKEDEWTDDEVKEKPLTESSIGELVDRVTSSDSFTALAKSIERMQTTASTRFWVLIAILAVIAFKI